MGSMFAQLKKRQRQDALKNQRVPKNLKDIIRQMTCPQCGEPPRPAIQIRDDVVKCPYCGQIILTLPPADENFLTAYEATVKQDGVIKEAARWFPHENVIAAGVFLGWLGARLAEELKHGANPEA